MADDPLMMGMLDGEVIQEAVDAKRARKKPMDAAAVQRAETAAKREERLSKPPPAPPPTPMPPPPPKVDKSSMLDRIDAYRERFPHLKTRNKLSGKSTVEEIADELHFMEQQLGQRDGHMGHSLFVLSLSALEEVTTNHYNPLNLNLNGLSKVAQDNHEEFAPILDELFIKYGAGMYVGPEMRLVMATATLVYTVHSANTGNPRVAQALAKMHQSVQVPKTDL